jgi:two-component system sensor histidine kinase EvgS
MNALRISDIGPEISGRFSPLDASIVLPALALVVILLAGISHAYMQLRRETRRRERSEAELADVTRHIPAVVYRFRYSPPSRVEFLYVGGNPEPIFGVGTPTFLHDEPSAFARIDERDQPAVLHAVQNAAAEGAPLHVEMRIRDTSPPRWVAAHALPRQAGHGVVEFSGYWIDVTAQREQAVALAAARDAAEAATAAKSEFLATMSHEIRTPMHGVLGTLELLSATTLDPTQRQLLSTVERSAETLVRILDDILDFSRVEAGALAVNLAPVDLRRLVADSVALVSGQARRKGLLMSVRVDDAVAPALLTDGVRLSQVLLNLLSNAVKFTDRGEVRVDVEAHGEARGRQPIRLTVSDTGIGIPPHEAARVFEPFEQAGNDTCRRFGGSGLGLAISRRLVRLLGGTIRLDSTVGEGTVVTVELAPAVSTLPADGGVASQPRIQAPQAPLHVLVAEDNAVARDLAAAQLERLGHRYTLASDGAEALVAAVAHTFDIILTDLQMPGIDGHRLARALRERGDGVYIVATTANAMDGEAERAREAGIDHVMVKPLKLDALRTLLANVPRRDTSRDSEWSLSHLAEQVGDASVLPDLVQAVAKATRDDLSRLPAIDNELDVARWAHHVLGALRSFGPSPEAAMLEAFEKALRSGVPLQQLTGLDVVAARIEGCLRGLEACASRQAG